MIVIRLVGVAGPFRLERKLCGQFLKSCDFEAHHGRGETAFTPHLAEAMRFPDKTAAFTYWRTQSKTVPLRTDGKPNRPLTAYHVVIEEEEE